MRELRTCDFCDGAAAGTFEIVPPELDPSEAEQRRVVLCRGCKGLLGELLEPLLARAGSTGPSNSDDADPLETTVDRASETGDGGAVDGAASTGTDGEPAVGGAGKAAGATGDDTGGNPGSDGDAAGGGDEAASDGDDAGEESGFREEFNSEADDGSDTEFDDGSDLGFDDESPGGSSDGTPGGSDDGSDDPGGITITTDEHGRESAGADQTDGDDASVAVASATSRSGPPRAYGKVLRLLRNREFPIPRADVEALAAGAYDLESHEVEAVIEHAIDQDELVEDGKQLRRT